MKIRFCTPLRSHSGYAELGRILVDQCLRAGHEVGVAEIPVMLGAGDFGPLAAQAASLLGRVPAPEVNVVNMIPPKFGQYRVAGARNIGCTMFETDRLPEDWIAQCNAMDAIWVPSQWVREMFVASGVRVPVSVVGVDAVASPWVAPPAEGLFRLLSVFDWSERKNPLGLLRAWCAAFDGDEGVALTLKASRHAEPQKTLEFVQAELRKALAGVRPRRSLPRIDIVPHVLSAAQMRQLHERCHAYVSLAHSEGWGLPPWEATLAGRPVIHTAWSAPMEFVHPQGQVACNLAPVYGMAEFGGFYDGGMHWADAHLDDAVAKLRALRSDYARWSEVAQAHREDVCARYSPAARIAQLQAALAA
jgi:glycosyltransferase involved in cell wall biosynthesis